MYIYTYIWPFPGSTAHCKEHDEKATHWFHHGKLSPTAKASFFISEAFLDWNWYQTYACVTLSAEQPNKAIAVNIQHMSTLKNPIVLKLFMTLNSVILVLWFPYSWPQILWCNSESVHALPKELVQGWEWRQVPKVQQH